METEEYVDSESSEAESSSEGSVTDEDSCEIRRMECLQDMIDLERQFCHLRNLLFQERTAQVERQLEEVICERAPDYLNRLKLLEETTAVRLQILDRKRLLQLQRANNVYDAENYAAESNFVNECKSAREQGNSEENNTFPSGTASADDWLTASFALDDQIVSPQDGQSSCWSISDEFGLERRKRPLIVSGPVVIYQLKEEEVFDDWRLIRASLQRQKFGHG